MLKNRSNEIGSLVVNVRERSRKQEDMGRNGMRGGIKERKCVKTYEKFKGSELAELQDAVLVIGNKILSNK